MPRPTQTIPLPARTPTAPAPVPVASQSRRLETPTLDALSAKFRRGVSGVSPRASELQELRNEIPGVGTISPKLQQLQQLQSMAVNYGIDFQRTTYEEFIKIAREIEKLRSQHNDPNLKVGDPLPSGDGTLRNYSHYFEDLNVSGDTDVLSDPNATGFGGGYSYRGKDPYP